MSIDDKFKLNKEIKRLLEKYSKEEIKNVMSIIKDEMIKE